MFSEDLNFEHQERFTECPDVRDVIERFRDYPIAEMYLKVKASRGSLDCFQFSDVEAAKDLAREHGSRHYDGRYDLEDDDEDLIEEDGMSP